MDRLIKIGKVQPKKSIDIEKSKISLGFEKLDRNVFDPHKAYPFVAQTGVKYARIQSGWMRTEKEKGVYDFAWLDDIVDNLIAIGIEPWMCLCYGNPIYTPWAAEYYGAVGCPPIETEEERQGWHNYVSTLTRRYAGKIHTYEVWNEPDGDWCWKMGPDPEELAEFTRRTAIACKEGDPTCEVLGFATCRDNRMNFLENLCQAGICDHIDGISYHSYRVTDQDNEQMFRVYDGIRQKYNPKLKLVQGESGTQSRPDGMGALRKASWTQEKQAKFLLRHMLLDLGEGVDMASYFSCMDMIEALNGKEGDVASYQDYAYFGILAADFDETGRSTGEYTPKLSFKALQNLCSIFCGDYEVFAPRIESLVEHSPRMFGPDYDFRKARHYGFRRPDGSWAVCYWHTESNILTQTYDGTVTLRLPKRYAQCEVKLIDLMTGDIYKFPPEMAEEKTVMYRLSNIPIRDYPLLLTFGDFYRE